MFWNWREIAAAAAAITLTNGVLLIAMALTWATRNGIVVWS